MGKHETGYARQDRDFYPTPDWAAWIERLPAIQVKVAEDANRQSARGEARDDR